MINFDLEVKKICDDVDAFYRRYSDDILIICKPQHERKLTELIETQIARVNLELNSDKFNRTLFDRTSGADHNETSVAKRQTAQYLGFNIEESGVTIRQSSISRQHRRLRQALRRCAQDAELARQDGRETKVWTKRLRRRFTSGNSQNFSSYAKRSVSVFGAEQGISKQIKKFERTADRGIRSLNDQQLPHE